MSRIAAALLPPGPAGRQLTVARNEQDYVALLVRLARLPPSRRRRPPAAAALADADAAGTDSDHAAPTAERPRNVGASGRRDGGDVRRDQPSAGREGADEGEARGGRRQVEFRRHAFANALFRAARLALDCRLAPPLAVPSHAAGPGWADPAAGRGSPSRPERLPHLVLASAPPFEVDW